MAQPFKERFKNRNQKITRLGIDNLECHAPISRIADISPIKVTAQNIICNKREPKSALLSSTDQKLHFFAPQKQAVQLMSSYDNLSKLYKSQTIDQNLQDFSAVDWRGSHEVIPQIHSYKQDAQEPSQLYHAKQGFFLAQRNSQKRKIQLYQTPQSQQSSENQEVNLEFSKKPRYVNFQPYQYKDFQKLKEDQLKIGGLGPSTLGSDQWKEATFKRKNANFFAKQVRLQNIQSFLEAHGQMNTKQ